VKRGKEGLSKIMYENNETMADQLLTCLQNADSAPDETLPNTGVSLEWERILSPMFIKSERYGTRSSTVLLMTDEEICYKERIYAKEGINDQQYTVNYSPLKIPKN
jgi:uncharacterized protein with NRDE domain